MHVIGTAGHVDHGKSAIVAALTGTNPDRLAEERERGMTLDLGFAHLRFADGIEGGIVDMPGHERFLHNMLAGAAGMEILLLVVDAVEGVRAQTLEHLAILAYLNVRRTIVVVSKIDLIEPAGRDDACGRIRQQLSATVAADAPCFAVSALTGENMQSLRDALHDELAQMRERNVAGAPAEALLETVLNRLREAQRAEAWSMGMTSIALARALGLPERVLVRVLEHFAGEGRLLNQRGYYATLEHQPALTPEQRAFFDRLVPLDEGQPFVPIPFAVVAEAVKTSRLTGISKAFDTMLARGTLVKVGDELYRGAQIGRIVEHVRADLEKNGTMTAAQFRDLLGTSRKYAVPLLEWLDACGVTIRSGDRRTLRKNV